MARGVPQSYCVDEFADEGMLFEGVAGPPDYMAMAVPYVGAPPPRADAQLPQHRAVRADGVRHQPRPRPRRRIVRYDLNRHDAATRSCAGSSASPSCSSPPARARSSCRSPARPSSTEAAAAPAPAGRDLKLMAFHPLGTAARRPRRRRSTPTCSVRGIEHLYVVRRQRGPDRARRQPAADHHGPRDPTGRAPVSFLIDPPWLYANGRIAAECPSRRASRSTAATVAHRSCVDEHLAVPQPAVDALDLAAVPRRRRPRLDAQLGRLPLRPRATPARARTRPARCCSRPTRCGCGWASGTAAR